MIRTVIVDDNADFLKAAELMLQELASVDVVGSANSGEKALEIVAKLEPDLMLIDLVMPGMHGDEAARFIAQASSGPKVILMSLFFTEGAKKRLRSSGAHGFVDKQHFVEQIEPLLHDLFGNLATG